jgi:hypothetical protein
MRLPLLPPASLSPDQQNLYDDMVDVIEKNFGELVARRNGKTVKSGRYLRAAAGQLATAGSSAQV